MGYGFVNILQKTSRRNTSKFFCLFGKKSLYSVKMLHLTSDKPWPIHHLSHCENFEFNPDMKGQKHDLCFNSVNIWTWDFDNPFGGLSTEA